MQREQLQRLADERSNPSLTISLNTHRTHPDNERDEIKLKNFLSEAKKRLIDEYGKRPIAALLDKIETVGEEIDVNYNLDSLHLFLSNDTQEIIRSTWPASNSGVHISDHFAVRPIIKDFVRTNDYLIMLLSQSGVHLYEATNNHIKGEVRNDDFPFSENRHYTTHAGRGSDAKHVDDLVREFINKVDKALVRVYNETKHRCVVISTEDNYSQLQQVADRPAVYMGYAPVNYNQVDTHHIAEQAWEVVKEAQHNVKAEAIQEVQEAVAQGHVFTDLQEVYQAAIDGRGELLIVHHNFEQPVRMTGERTFDLISDPTEHDAIDDIASVIAWEVLSKGGRVIFTSQDELKELGEIVLKTRY